jgi:hypothetical protein
LDGFELALLQILSLSLPALKSSLHPGASTPTQPALIAVIFLLSTFLRHPRGHTATLEELTFLNRAKDALHESVKSPARAVETIQASWLLSIYFLCTGSEREATFYASAAATLALQGDPIDRNTPLGLEKEKERMAAFWAMYCLDKFWSPSLRKQSAFPDALMQGTIPSSSDDPLLAHRIRVSTLYERASRFSRASFPNQAALLQAFSELQPPIYELAEVPHPTIRSLAHAATILLFNPMGRSDPSAWACQVIAAQGCARVADEVREWAWVDPSLEPCLALAADVLLRELASPRSQIARAEVQGAFDRIVYATRTLGERFPIFSGCDAFT